MIASECPESIGAALSTLVEELVPHWAQAQIRALLSSPSSDVLLFIEGENVESGKVDGFACLTPATLAENAYVLRWLVCRENVDAGRVAASLLDQIDTEITALGGRLIRFDGASFRCVGIPITVFDGAGYERVGSIEDFYGVGEDLVIFVRRIVQPFRVIFDPRNPAHLFQVAFAYRDFRFERDFLLSCARRWGVWPVQRVASWASLAGSHLVEFARLGIEAVGIDDSEGLLELAESTIKGVPWLESKLRLFHGDLGSTPQTAPVELSFCSLSAVHRAGSVEGIRRHLDAAARLLAPGGLHVIEAMHPKDLLPGGASLSAWTEVFQNYRVQSRFQLLLDKAPNERVVDTLLEVVSRDSSGAPVQGGSLQLKETWYVPSAAEWERLARQSAVFSVEAMLGDFNVDVPWDRPGAWRLLVVLRRNANIA